MTTDPAPSGLQPFSQLKAGPTTYSSKSTAVPAPTTTIAPSQSSRRLQPKSDSRNEQLNGANDRALAALVRRVLCPQSGSYGGATFPYAPEELLPPLTSSNDVDRQLYALVAMMVKEFISSWYSKITSDQALISEVLQLIAHLTRALEQRLREVDIVQLALDDISSLVETHITSYRLATEQSNLSGLAPSSREIYHALNPHPGLSPVPDPSDANSVAQQRDSEAIYRRLLVNGVLTVLLPTEDLENACLRTLLTDILSDLILGNQVSERVCEGWFVWETTTKLLDMLSRDKHGREAGAAETKSPRPNRLHRFGLLGNTDSDNDTASSQPSDWIWLFLQYAFYAYVTLRFIVVGLFRKASSSTLNPSLRPPDSFVDKTTTKYAVTGKRPVLDYRLFGMLSQLLDLSRRMPWLGGLIALFQYLILAGPGKVGDTGSVLDRFLHENIEEYVLTPTLLPNLLQALREALFPHNTRPKSESSVNRVEALTSTSTPAPLTPGAQPAIDARQTTTASGGNTITPSDNATEELPRLSPDQQRRPSPAEVASIRRKCALGILSLIPRPIARRLFGVPTEPSSRVISTQVGSPALSPSQFQAAGPGVRSDSPSSPSPEVLGSYIRSDAEESLLASAIESNILDLFADEYCNKHLVYSIIETVLAKLMPELSDRSIAELMEDRAVFTPAV